MNLTFRDGFLAGLITAGLIAFGVMVADSYVQEVREGRHLLQQELRNYVDMRINAKVKGLEDDINQIVVEMPDAGQQDNDN